MNYDSPKNMIPAGTFPKTSGTPISAEEAQSQLNAYRKFRLSHPNDAIAHFIGKDRLLKLIERTEAVGVRVYYGLDANGNRTANFFAVNEKGENIRISLNELKDDGDSGGYTSDQPCPNHCPPPNSAPNTSI